MAPALPAGGEGDHRALHLPASHDRPPRARHELLGLKTFAANTIAANGDDEQTRADIARAFEDAVVDTLAIKCRRALKETGLNRLVVAGGVSANRHLRAQLAELMENLKGEVFYPRTEYCTDNGAMIAYAGMQRLKAGVFEPLAVKAVPRWPLDTLDPV